MTFDVTLVEITEENLGKVLNLKVTPDQEGFVASNAVSISQAYFDKAAWFRAIEAEGAFVGFVMLSNPNLSEKGMTQKECEEMYLWRFMIGAEYQKKGFGARALDLIFDHAREQAGLKRMLASFVDAPGGPEEFYLRYGFKKTGNIPDGEVEIIMDL